MFEGAGGAISAISVTSDINVCRCDHFFRFCRFFHCVCFSRYDRCVRFSSFFRCDHCVPCCDHCVPCCDHCVLSVRFVRCVPCCDRCVRFVPCCDRCVRGFCRFGLCFDRLWFRSSPVNHHP
jgi:hypothetical protein